MSTYTLRGSKELDTRINTDLQRITEGAASFTSAGILLGGYGRGEGTPFVLPDGSQASFNDYDLVVVVDKLTHADRQMFNTLEQQLTAELGLPVDLCPYRKRDLPTREFSLLNYEMKHGHKIVWGDPDILSAMPDYPHDAIPLSEGSRLLLNRGKLLLDIKQRLAQADPLTEEERFRFIKFIFKAWLAFGDCSLLAEGRYDISYSVKKERMALIGEIPDRSTVTDHYLRAIELKEWGDYHALADFNVAEEFESVRTVFLRFLPWYRAQYSGLEGTALKNLALNLRWNRRLSIAHPREQLYDALFDLLQDRSAMPAERFYMLQGRFS